MGETLAGLGIFLLSSIPTLIVLGLFIAAAVFIIRRIIRRIRRKKEQKKEQKNIQQADGAEENAPADKPENGPADET